MLAVLILNTHIVAAAGALPRQVSGHVTDASGEPLIGVNVSCRPYQGGTVTDIDGNYVLAVPEGCHIISFSYVGMEPRSVDIGSVLDSTLVVDIEMHESQTVLQEVVVTGMFKRPAASFTGSSVAYTVEKLEEGGNQNVLNSLKNIDPSIKVDNVLASGSNPNVMPDMQIRGSSSINLSGDYKGNVNQPLVILDGFEVTMERLYDIDMARVESVTLLKDAAAKAIYGSKAGNGVIVVETRAPKGGRLRIYYTGTIDIETPVLGDYNLMDARAKLNFEVSRGMYDKANTLSQLQAQHDLLKARRDNIASGVDTDWLSLATRTGVGTKQNISLEGGSGRWRFLGGLTYSSNRGVMKGSGRQTVGGNAAVTWNGPVRIRYMVDFSHLTAEDSPYGAFSQFLIPNAYLKPYGPDGAPTRVLCAGDGGRPVYNPLYNGSLSTSYREKQWSLRNNLSVDYAIGRYFTLLCNFSYTYQKGTDHQFLPYGHTDLEIPDQQGRYFKSGRLDRSTFHSSSLQGRAAVNFSLTDGPSIWFANVSANLQSDHLRRHRYSTVNALLGDVTLTDLGQARAYLEERPYEGDDDHVREIGFVAAGGYSYDNRYLLDVSLRESGSSIFGRDNRWGTFWSVGAGWNIHNEAWMRDATWLKTFKLRGSTGYMGSQTFNPYSSRSRYIYYDYTYGGHYGATLSGLPNDGLGWQKVHDTDLGVDLGVTDWLNLKFDYYWQRTDDMLLDVNLAPSTGFISHKVNLGQIDNHGYEFMLSLSPWRDSANDGWATLSVSGMHNSGKVSKTGQMLDTYNKTQNRAKTTPLSITDRDATRSDFDADRLVKTTPSMLYYDGCSTTAIWGVPSLGVDPLTGRRVYVNREGRITYDWLPEDQVVIGDRAPKLSGNIVLSGGFKGFSAGVNLGYSLGGDIYNITLVNKVENVTGYDNLDRRIADSWQKPGDISPYRALNITDSEHMQYTLPNSAFVQRNNELSVTALSVGYEFGRLRGVRRLGFDRLKLSFYVTDLCRWSTVHVERGTDYPYARTFSVSVQAIY